LSPSAFAAGSALFVAGAVGALAGVSTTLVGLAYVLGSVLFIVGAGSDRMLSFGSLVFLGASILGILDRLTSVEIDVLVWISSAAASGLFVVDAVRAAPGTARNLAFVGAVGFVVSSLAGVLTVPDSPTWTGDMPVQVPSAILAVASACYLASSLLTTREAPA
jgi:hypothetical protein